MKELWKKFDEIELTHSSVHHLMAIFDLLQIHGYVRAVDIANYLNISRSSVSITIRKLKNRGYVTEDENKFYRLAAPGEQLIQTVLTKRGIIRIFFREVLNLPDHLAEAEACKIEHLLEEETGQKLMSFIGLYLSENKIAEDFRNIRTDFNYHCDTTEACTNCAADCYFASHPFEIDKPLRRTE